MLDIRKMLFSRRCNGQDNSSALSLVPALTFAMLLTLLCPASAASLEGTVLLT